MFLRAVISIIILSLAGCIIYSNTLSSPFCFDDYYSVVANPDIRHPAALKKIWDFWPTRFLTYCSFALNYRYGNLDVFGYHWFNLAVHIICGVLVWWLCLLTFSAPISGSCGNGRTTQMLAFFSGLLFIAHPIQTEAVTYIVQRATSLAALFYLASLVFYVKARILFCQRASIWKVYYCGALITAVSAMFTKEMTITLPLAVVLYEFCFLKKGKYIYWKFVIPFLLTLFIIPLTMLITGSADLLGMHRAIESAPDISRLHYLFTEFRVIVTYLRLIFLPLNQNLDYDYAVSRSLIEFNTLISLLVLVAILVFALLLLRRHRLISFGIFWFFLTLLPESSIIPIRDVIFEHRLYLSMFGYSLFTVSVVHYFFGRKNMKTVFVVLIILTVSYACLAYKRNSIWQDELVLWNDTIAKSPRKGRPYNERGFVYLLRGSYNYAIADFTKAVEIDPGYVSAFNNRGIAHIKKSDYGKAILDFTQAIKIEAKYSPAYSNRAVAYFCLHEYAKAWEDFNRATALGAAIDSKFFEDLKKAGIPSRF